MQGVTGLALHNVRFRFLVRQWDRRHHVCTQIDAKNRDRSQRQRNVGADEEEERRDLGNVGGQSVGDGLLQVVEHQTSFLELSEKEEKDKWQEIDLKLSNTNRSSCNVEIDEKGKGGSEKKSQWVDRIPDGNFPLESDTIRTEDAAHRLNLKEYG